MSVPVEYWQCLHVTQKTYDLKSHFYHHINRGLALYRAFAAATLLCRPSSPSFHRHSPLSLFCPPGIGSLSFQRSSIWTRSWRTRSKALKTSWPRRATRDRVSSLTSTACEWQCEAQSRACCWRCEWMPLSAAVYVSVALFYCLFSDISGLCYAGSLTSPFPIKAISVWPQLPFFSGSIRARLCGGKCQKLLL